MVYIFCALLVLLGASKGFSPVGRAFYAAPSRLNMMTDGLKIDMQGKVGRRTVVLDTREI